MFQSTDDSETSRVDRAAYEFCGQKCKSVMTDWTALPSSSKRDCSGVHGSDKPAGTHETKPDQSTGKVLFAVGCRGDRPIVDSGSVVSTCPVDYATSVPTEKVHYSMNLGIVLRESLQHHGIERNVPSTNRCKRFWRPLQDSTLCMTEEPLLSMMESMSMMKGKNLRATLDSVFPSYVQSIGNEN